MYMTLYDYETTLIAVKSILEEARKNHCLSIIYKIVNFKIQSSKF